MMKVVQCWDDGVVNDIRLTELLRKYNAKATFNLNPGLMGEYIPSSWVKPGDNGWSHQGYRGGKIALKDIGEIFSGFELASHCWRHENAGSIPDSEWIKSALDARHFLEDIVQRDCLGFAWPCGVSTPETARLLRENGFAYGRTTKYLSDITKCADAMELPSNCHFLNGGFWNLYEQAKENGNKVFYFWGHSYEMFEYDKLWELLEDKIRYISEDPDAEWANVVDIVPLVEQK